MIEEFSTHYVTLPNLDLSQLYDLYNNYYQDSEFIRILDQTYPKLSQVNKTNNCIISLFESSDKNETSNLVIMCAIDNLIKGASGQAIQNMNIMFNLKETHGF